LGYYNFRIGQFGKVISETFNRKATFKNSMFGKCRAYNLGKIIQQKIDGNLRILVDKKTSYKCKCNVKQFV